MVVAPAILSALTCETKNGFTRIAYVTPSEGKAVNVSRYSEFESIRSYAGAPDKKSHTLTIYLNSKNPTSDGSNRRKIDIYEITTEERAFF